MKVIISAEAHAAIRARARGEFKQEGKLRPDGNYEVELSNITLDRLNKARFRNEQLSDTVLRVCLTADKPTN